MTYLDVARIKEDFPILRREVHGHRLVYLDSASSSQKPIAVLDAMDQMYRTSYANVHRGVYTIAEEATAAYENARTKVARFVNAPSTAELVFTRNATEAINLVAYTWARANLREGDAIVLTHLEHHANVVPWHMLAAERGVEVRWIPMTPDYELDLSNLDALLDGAKLLGVSAMSNVLGTMPPVRQLVDAAHAVGALALVDACQYVPHNVTDVQAWDADFVAFSAHKLLGPTGIGALWGREALLDAMPPFLGGGEMIRDVRLDGFTPNELPWKFEAGTQPIAEAVGFGAAVDYLSALGMDAVRAHEKQLTAYALNALLERFPRTLHIYGPLDVERRGGAVSFLFDEIHAHDVSQVLDEDGVCVRAGHHCAKPLMRVLGVPATTRASFYVYNDETDVDVLVESLAKAEKFFLG
ncbi:MAG: cysteine desulfurase-like protein SufS subfamily [Actinomycetia bacterium]|nr:cysteine desulfurase-like protein SufS subfamily [Actinomycetes bacterium]